MENASKALIMAASVLIGVMIISIAVYLFVTFGFSSKKIHKEIDNNRLNEFNTQFTKYEGKDDNTIYDIISITNLAKENNEYYELSNASNGSFYITVNASTSIEKKTDLQKYTKIQIDDLIKKEELVNGKLPTYSCKVTISQKTGRVEKVEFKQK